jgi:rubrerythrin
MTDRLTEAVRELKEKSPFVCTSCGHPADISKVSVKLSDKTSTDFHDRFTDAAREEGEKSAFVCESCGHHQIVGGGKLH